MASILRRSHHRVAFSATAPAAVALVVLLAIGARGWIGHTFPGFLLLPNRVVASIGLPGWTGSQEGTIYQTTVVSVNGERVASTAEVYRRVAQAPPGTPFTYALRTGTTTNTVTIASQTFSYRDYWAIFGAYLATGTAYLALGFLGAWLLGDEPLGRALLVLGGIGGLYTLSAIDLYGPTSAMRVNALTEPLFAAALLHVALLASRSQKPFVAPIASGAWWLALSLAGVYQFLLDQPGAYSPLHAAAEGALGVAGLVMIGVLLVDRTSDGDRWRTAATAGALLGLGLPTLVFILSSLSGGRLPVNLCASTASFFPLCFGYGLVRDRIAAATLQVRSATV
jgi:hypothetical protein